jgi:Glu-tRNA(Gln) amidotransferase subunit E-like FAD-binding protein
MNNLKENPEFETEYDADFLGAITELESNEEIELVNHEQLFQKIDSNKIFKIFEETERRAKTNSIPTHSNKKNGLINEDYLRNLINSEVNSVISEAIDTIVENVSYQIEKAISIAMNASNYNKTENDEQQ